MFNSELIEKLPIIQTWGKNPKRDVTLTIDSRTYEMGDIFVAIKGDSFDGTTFIESVISKGCELIVFPSDKKLDVKIQELSKKYEKVFFVGVECTLKFLQELATIRISEWKLRGGRVIGITGSNGKTTTKNMLYHLLNQVSPHKVHATDGNFNNHIGVPLTILKLTDKHKIAIIEMGSNHFGEIQLLCEIARPDYGIISSIGEAHLEFFKDLDGVFKEKRTLYDYVSQNEGDEIKFVICKDDSYLRRLEKNSDVYSYSINDYSSLVLQNKNILGNHNWSNMIGSYLLAKIIVPTEKTRLQEAISSFVFEGNRSTITSAGSKSFYLDAYNANPSSMRASIEAFVDYCSIEGISSQDVLFIVGDMNELGSKAEGSHRMLAVLMKQLEVKNVCFVGKYGKYFKKEFESVRLFKDIDELLKIRDELFDDYRWYFLKASRSIALERFQQNL